MVRYGLFFLLCALAAGCGTAPTESLGAYQPKVYVEGFLRAGQGVDSVFVGTTMPLYETYDRSSSALTDATVSIEADGQSHALSPLPGKPGYYTLPSLKIEAGKTYDLTVTTSYGTATAETTVPDPPSVTASAVTLTVGGDPIQIQWDGKTEEGYVTTQQPIELGDVIPLDQQFSGNFGRFFGGAIDTTGFGAVRDSLTAVRDSLARADQWRLVQNRSISLNSRQFTYYGTYAFLVYAIDGNYADFLASSNQDPQVLNEPRFHVSGGLGIFASMAADSVVFRVE